MVRMRRSAVLRCLERSLLDPVANVIVVVVVIGTATRS